MVWVGSTTDDFFLEMVHFKYQITIAITNTVEKIVFQLGEMGLDSDLS